ncbi:hypothetical protein Xen7305DRAFT_00042280 [Xenococcus sp. PCC 7305]|nr:hypothetical protein Xen7305DRAFT_00042280 [Xenococcus sp. PCC 7305]
MSATQIIHCPNCGSFAEKNSLDNHIVRTSCNSCDYLLVQCAKTFRVIESYAPGINCVMPAVERAAVERPAAERLLVAHKQH